MMACGAQAAAADGVLSDEELEGITRYLEDILRQVRGT
jgi:hypothetical protein